MPTDRPTALNPHCWWWCRCGWCRPPKMPELAYHPDRHPDAQRCQSRRWPTVTVTVMPKCQSHPDAQSVRACQSLPTMTDPPPCQSLRLSHTRIRTHITHITRYTLHALHTSRATRVSTKASTKDKYKSKYKCKDPNAHLVPKCLWRAFFFNSKTMPKQMP